MKLAVETLFEEVVFAPKSRTPVKIRDFNAVGRNAMPLTNMTPWGLVRWDGLQCGFGFYDQGMDLPFCARKVREGDNTRWI